MSVETASVTGIQAQMNALQVVADFDPEQPLPVGSFHAYQTQTVKNLPIWAPCLILVQAGIKDVQVRQQRLRVSAGELLLIPAGVRCHLQNQPDPQLGEYRALAFELSPQDIAHLGRQLQLGPVPATAGLQLLQLRPSHELAYSLQSFVEALQNQQQHPAIVRHRLQEVLLQWLLQDSRVWCLLQPRAEDITSQVQTLIAQAPQHPWSLTMLAEQLHRSVATLSRQLREENTGLRAILDDVRLVHGFNLIQTSHASLDQIAEDCGYQSLARFSARFRAYFGLTPAQLRRTREPI